MSEEFVVRFLRKRDNKRVFPVCNQFLERNDMYPCDEAGNFVSPDSDELVAAETAEVVKTMVDEKDNSVIVALIERAKELGIKSAHRMKESTLIKRINDAEAELQESEEK